MATINQRVIERLMSKLGVSKSRVYDLIKTSANKNRVRRHIAALLVAGENGISIQRYASADDLNELRGVSNHVPVVEGPPAAAPPPRAILRKGKGARIPKTKENTVFVIHGRDNRLRDGMYELLSALGLKPQEWGHAIRAARGRGGNPYVNDAVTKVMERAQALVVMFSPDDEAKLKDQFVGPGERQTEGKLRGQARPNVIFETGIALGVHHKKTLMIKIGDVKQFTDIGGMHMLNFTGSPASRHEFANRLRDMDCKVDTDGDRWLTVGDFTPTGPKKRRRKASRRRAGKGSPPDTRPAT